MKPAKKEKSVLSGTNVCWRPGGFWLSSLGGDVSPLVGFMREHLKSRRCELRPYSPGRSPDHFGNFRVELAVLYLAGYSPSFVMDLFREVFPAKDTGTGEGRIYGLMSCNSFSVLGSYRKVLEELRMGDLASRIGKDWLRFMKFRGMGPWSVDAPEWLRELFRVETLAEKISESRESMVDEPAGGDPPPEVCKEVPPEVVPKVSDKRYVEDLALIRLFFPDWSFSEGVELSVKKRGWVGASFPGEKKVPLFLDFSGSSDDIPEGYRMSVRRFLEDLWLVRRILPPFVLPLFADLEIMDKGWVVLESLVDFHVDPAKRAALERARGVETLGRELAVCRQLTEEFGFSPDLVWLAFRYHLSSLLLVSSGFKLRGCFKVEESDLSYLETEVSLYRVLRVDFGFSALHARRCFLDGFWVGLAAWLCTGDAEPSLKKGVGRSERIRALTQDISNYRILRFGLGFSDEVCLDVFNCGLSVALMPRCIQDCRGINCGIELI